MPEALFLFSVGLFSWGAWLIATCPFTSDTLTLRHAELGAHTKVARAVAFSHNGAMLASGSDDLSIKVWSVGPQGVYAPRAFHRGLTALKMPLQLFAGSLYPIFERAYAHSLVHTGTAGTITWEGEISCVAFSPDDTKIVSSGKDGSIAIWELADARPYNASDWVEDIGPGYRTQAAALVFPIWRHTPTGEVRQDDTTAGGQE